MRILVVSDTHGINEGVIDLINREDFDVYIHLGDYIRDCEYIERLTGINFIKIKGNNDFFDIDNDEEKIIEIGGIRILLLHGHKDGVYFGMEKLFYKAKSRNVDICLFGHTHVYFYGKYEDIIFLNPGSPSRPRGGDFKKSCAMIDISDGKIDVKRILI